MRTASATALTVLLGTLYPLMREAATGQPISVGPPYFNLTFAPVMAFALVVLPAGPLLALRTLAAELEGLRGQDPLAPSGVVSARG